MKHASMLLPAAFWVGWLANSRLKHWMNCVATPFEAIGTGLVLMGVLELIAIILR